MTTERDRSIDLLRGLAIWGMLLNGNQFIKKYWWNQLQHGSWFEATLVDFVYPLFLFVAGRSLFLVVKKNPPNLLKKQFWRSVRIILLGMFLAKLPLVALNFNPGTLQCIGVILFLSYLILRATDKNLWQIALLIQLVGLVLSLLLSTSWNENETFYEQVDYKLLGHSHGVEGILATLVAVSFVIAGAEFQRISKDNSKRISIISSGVALVALALILSAVGLIPIVPDNFSLSFSLYAIGGFLLCSVIFQKVSSPVVSYLLLPFGYNSIFVYAGVIAVRKTFLTSCVLYCTPENPTLHQVILALLQEMVSEQISVYLLASLYLGFFWLISLWMLKKNIQIKI